MTCCVEKNDCEEVNPTTAEGCLHINYISSFKGSNFQDLTPLITTPVIRLLMLLSRFIQVSKCSVKPTWHVGAVMVW